VLGRRQGGTLTGRAGSYGVCKVRGRRYN
jgi:hypothetical protein